MKKILLALLLITPFGFLSAQICNPDTTRLSDSTIIDPLPFQVAKPGSGIPTKACLNTPYAQTFSVQVPESIILPAIGAIELNYVQLISIDGLPTGLTFSCNQADCKIYKNTFDCFLIHGTPAGTNAPGNYDIKINFKINTVLLGDINYSFPDPNLAPGTYTITLFPEGSPECISAVREVAAPDIQIDCAQTAEGVEFRVVSDLHFSSKLFLCDVNGKQVALKTTEIKPGSNHIQVDNNNLTPGIYFYQFTGKYGQKSGKLIIN